MSQANESRIETKVEGLHSAGRPFHYAAPNQEDRIRRVFALDAESPLPAVDDATLASYFEYLAANLAIPFEALYCPTGGDDPRQLIHYVRVVELLDPRRSRNHNFFGLFCKAQNAKGMLELPLDELGVRDENPNCQLIDDYAYWFVNCR